MRFTFFGPAVLAAALFTLSGCVSSEFAAIKTEPGYYYGFGSGASETAAQEAAFQDLVYNTFTETGSIKKESKARTVLTAEMKAALAVLAPKPYLAEKKSATSFTAVYRVKYADWTKAETARLAQLQGSLGGRFNAVSSDTKKSLGDRLAEVGQIALAIQKNGVPLSLKTGGADSTLLSQAMAQWSRDQLAGATLKIQSEGGLIQMGQPVPVALTDKAGKPIGGIPLSAVWTSEGTDAPALALTTDAKGLINAPYPTEDRFKNKRALLKVSTRIGALAGEPTFLFELDAALKTELAFRNAEDLAKARSEEVKVEGGTFTVGAVKQDRRAGGNEKPRTVTVASFYIDLKPVTNAQYRSFLEATNVPKSKWPDYIDSEEQGGANQPVVGVTWAEANAYAAWLSGVLGVKKRLPTEDEYEIAARAGQSTIFPWGDQSPTDGVRANYSGNKKFSSTSPVGSFANGRNPLGLDDMVGNVWQWTSTSPDASMTADPSFKIVKGGSWLDGPNDLRISNRRAVDPAEPTGDIGFRLVREDNQ